MGGRTWGAQPRVARQGGLQAAAQGHALDGCHGRLGAALQQLAEVVIDPVQPRTAPLALVTRHTRHRWRGLWGDTTPDDTGRSVWHRMQAVRRHTVLAEVPETQE